MKGLKPTVFALTLVLFFSSCSDVKKDINAKVSQKSAGNDLSAISALRIIRGAENNYMSTAGSGQFGTLKQLIDSQLIDPSFANGKNGYKYEVRLKPPNQTSYEALATPIEYGLNGNQSFYMGEDGVLHGADKKGAEANSTDPLIGN